MIRSSALTALTLLLASATAGAEGHGPLFALATPTLGQGQWSSDTGFMLMQHDTGGRWRMREMIGYGLHEDLQLNLSIALDRDAGGYVANARSGAMMAQPGATEAGLLWRFHRYAPAVGERRESSLLVAVGDSAKAGAGGRETGASMHLAAVTGYASRTLYWWLGGGFQRFRGEDDFRRGDLTYVTAVFGWRPPLFRDDYPRPDWRLFVEAVAERATRDRIDDVADGGSGGTRLMAGPSVLGLYGSWGISAGVLV
ncbi:MAG: hypothetical protein ACREQZ_07660, partial [Woeseiaceae bacterium]